MIEWFKKNSFFIILGIFIVGFLFITREKEEVRTNEIIPVDLTSEETEEEENFLNEHVVVDIKGEINKPGVYELDFGARVEDVIKMADGFTNDAEETAINLAQKLHDEMIIIVPNENDEETGKNQESSSTSGEEVKIRVNYATQEEIENLPGIGPSKAQAIIDYREENGLFQSVEDLLDISGIGEKTLENMRDYIHVP
ncbi:helix-hairpin-helix domain-containing protein [Virgibacillus sp. MSJ-26]|uniref:helix-hairpin-helix domain-containing protein n=1 Tax=Virgibacillus sp. MSJ-26 TaxID=2841522 RepID=UPI001C0F883E|nr:helix-hairpin-helix domain-containing protein [Virgibacillus sp. MSJ-26]MBU5466457.1 helix-hairpin-helix domain-containing protein [Virgibacillus sp. MSJ-26]